MLTLIAILSDIHGNLPALESVLEDMRQFEIEKVVSLGDLSGYYPYINEVIELLRRYNAINLIGNHDRYVIDNTDCPRSTSANLALRYQKSVITQENIAWLRQSLPTLRIGDASFVHGGWEDPEDEYLYRITPSYFEKYDARFFFCGHTHVQKKIALGKGKHFINPGSVGQPRDGIADAAYAIFDPKAESVILRRVAYDIDSVAERMKSLGFDEKFYANLYNGTRIGGKIDTISYIEA